MVCVSLRFDCDTPAALITPGNVFLTRMEEAREDWFPGAEELLAVDAMTGPSYSILSFDAATVELTIKSPAGCMFVAPGAQAPFRPYAEYEMEVGGVLMPFTADSSVVRVTRWEPSGQVTLNDNNSSSFWLGIKGRNEAAIDVEVCVTATGNVRAEAKSCQWEIKGLTPFDQLGGRFYPSCG